MKTILEVDEIEDDETGGDELSDVEDVFVGDEAELPKRVYYDARPSKEEVELHDLTHLPYRSWCPHCVKGKAKRHHHRKKRQKKRSEVPVISIDYMWLKGKKVMETMKTKETLF